MSLQTDRLVAYWLTSAGIVEAWTAGATWEQITNDCNLEGGDLARLLSRTTDMLRQVQLPPTKNRLRDTVPVSLSHLMVKIETHCNSFTFSSDGGSKGCLRG